jgi:hypothetical protein
MMTTISFEFDGAAALRLAPNDFTHEMRIAAAIQWHAQGLVSQGRGADLAGLDQADFLDLGFGGGCDAPDGADLSFQRSAINWLSAISGQLSAVSLLAFSGQLVSYQQ